jgi:hypothetical protein
METTKQARYRRGRSCVTGLTDARRAEKGEELVTETIRARRHAVTKHGIRGVFAALASLALLAVLAAPTHAAQYRFTKVADSARDNFNPNSFTCASINNRRDIAFRAGRTDGLNSFDGIYRANADGSLTTIAEDPDRTRFGFLGNFPSINDLGDVSFAANLAPDFDQAILRGNGTEITTIATTTDEFNFFGFDTSVNNSGEVAFKAELDNFAEGLFSGSGGAVTTHYLNSTDVLLDGRLVRFGGNDSRPSINNLGDIAFDETIQPEFDSGIFVGREGSFRTIAAPDPNRSVQEPVLNDLGTTAFETSFFDAAGQFVTAIVKGSGGPLTTVADTTGPFGFFGFRPPAINNNGDVAFSAILDDDFPNTSIYVGPDPKKDMVIGTGDRLDGATISNVSFCEEGLNDSGEVAFIAELTDRRAPEGRRTAVFHATPR